MWETKFLIPIENRKILQVYKFQFLYFCIANWKIKDTSPTYRNHSMTSFCSYVLQQNSFDFLVLFRNTWLLQNFKGYTTTHRPHPAAHWLKLKENDATVPKSPPPQHVHMTYHRREHRPSLSRSPTCGSRVNNEGVTLEQLRHCLSVLISAR